MAIDEAPCRNVAKINSLIRHFEHVMTLTMDIHRKDELSLSMCNFIGKYSWDSYNRVDID